ncbi:hypothetical protein Tco_1460701, partial [Tanacetum coccineum]
KSTTGGCQFLGRRLISWQCKKQTIMANSTTEAEYVAAANCYGQVLWIRNQMMDYGFNFMNTRIHIDNESTISVIKNPVAHSRTKHIKIRFQFIRDCYEKRLIEVVKIHTDSDVADLLPKGFDVTRFKFLVVIIGIQFVISKDKSIDSAFARFNTIITSLKDLDDGYSSKNYVRMFLRALHPKWRAKVTTIEELKDLTSLSLDELIRNLKVHEMIIKKDSKIVKVRDFKKFFKRRECPKPPKDKNQRAFVGDSWSDSGKEDDEKAKDEMCLVAQASNEMCSDSSYFSDENSSIDDLTLDNEYDRLCKMSLKNNH